MLLQIISAFLIMFSSVLCAPGGDKYTKLLHKDDSVPADTSSALKPSTGRDFNRRFGSERNESESNFIHTPDMIALSESSDKQSNAQNNDQMRSQPARSNKILKLGSRGTLDPIGGGHLLKVDDSYRSEESIWDSFDNFVNKLAILAVLYSNYSGNSQNTTPSEPIKRNKTEPDTRGTLDSLGGGNFVRFDDSYRSEESVWDSFDNFIKRLAVLSMIYSKSYNRQNTTQPEPVKKDRTQPDTRGTLDPIGGGNLIRLVDSYRIRQFEQSTRDNSGESAQPEGRNNQQSSGHRTLDSLGDGNYLKFA